MPARKSAASVGVWAAPFAHVSSSAAASALLEVHFDTAHPAGDDVVQRRKEHGEEKAQTAIEDRENNDGPDADQRAETSGAAAVGRHAAGHGDQGHDSANEQAHHRIQGPGNFSD